MAQLIASRKVPCLAKPSEYVTELSSEARERYENKVFKSGLTVDPYVIAPEDWTREPSNLPDVQWTDLVLYMVTTPSPYTAESLKVNGSFISY